MIMGFNLLFYYYHFKTKTHESVVINETTTYVHINISFLKNITHTKQIRTGLASVWVKIVQWTKSDARNQSQAQPSHP